MGYNNGTNRPRVLPVHMVRGQAHTSPNPNPNPKRRQDSGTVPDRLPPATPDTDSTAIQRGCTNST